jgi:hypothetical protein
MRREKRFDIFTVWPAATSSLALVLVTGAQRVGPCNLAKERKGDKLTVVAKPKPSENEMMAGLLLHFSLANLRVFTLRQAYYHTEGEWE